MQARIEALEASIKRAAELISTMSSIDGSGHADLAAAIYRMAEIAQPDSEAG